MCNMPIHKDILLELKRERDAKIARLTRERLEDIRVRMYSGERQEHDNRR